MNKKTLTQTALLGAGLALALLPPAAQAQSGSTSQTQDEQNMTAGAASAHVSTAFQDQLRRASDDFNAEKFGVAAGELRTIIGKDRDNLMAHQMLAAVYQKQNDVHDMMTELQDVIRLSPQDVSAQSNLSIAYLQTGEFDKAIPLLARQVAAKPKDGQKAYYYGLALAQSGKTAEAIPVLQNAVKLKPSAPAFLQLGAALDQSGKTDDAIAALQSAVKLDPKDSQSALYEGMLLHRTSHDDQAIPVVQKALALGTSNQYGAHMILAEIYGSQGKNDLAVAQYKLAVAAKPTDFGAAANLGVVTQNSGAKADAILAYKRALTLAAPTPEAKAQVEDSLADLLAEAGAGTDAGEAVTLLQGAIQDDPKNAQYQSDLGQVYEKQGKKDDAAAAYTKAIALDPKQFEAKSGLARLTPKK